MDNLSDGETCWYCGLQYKDDKYFYISREFDTSVHLKCIEQRLWDHPNDQEALIFENEFKPLLDERKNKLSIITNLIICLINYSKFDKVRYKETRKELKRLKLEDEYSRELIIEILGGVK